MITEPKPVAKDNVIYFVDNGAVYCGAHLGMSARYTGYDISGQKIERITRKVLKECLEINFIPKCESCGLEAKEN